MAITESRLSFVTTLKPIPFFQPRNSLKKSPVRPATHDHDHYAVEISSIGTEEGEIISPERAARVAQLKARFSKIILKAQKILNSASTSPTTADHHHHHHDDQVDHLKVEKPGNLIVKKPTQRSRNQHDDNENHLIKKKRSRDQSDDRDFNQLVKKKRSSSSSPGIIEKADEDDQKMKRKQEIEREREAARIAINNITKTVDFDNLSVMVEFEKLLGSKF